MSKNKPKIRVCITSLGATSRQYNNAISKYTQLNEYFDVSIDKRIIASDVFGSRRASERFKSLSEALKNSDIALAWDGGFNSIELLAYSELFRTAQRSRFAGYSDNTIIANALSQGSFYGPSMDDYLNPARLNQNAARSLYLLYKKDIRAYSSLYELEKVKIITPGVMKGRILGGNNYSFSLLQGNQLCPEFNKPYILFMEGEDILKRKEYIWRDFIRNIDAIMLLPSARENLQGLMVGRFPDTYNLKYQDIKGFLQTRDYLKRIPIVFDVPCGHGQKPLYLPLNQAITIVAEERVEFR